MMRKNDAGAGQGVSVIALGARVVMEHEQAAIFIDPTGAAFAVQEWAPREPASGEETP